jgi:hypothetical protein
MILSPSIFEQILIRFGVEVDVITRTPKEEDGEIQRTTKGNVIYDEETNTVTARILDNPGSEAFWKNTMMQTENAVGLFRLTDKDYLNENSRVLYDGKIYYMKKPVKRQTHYEVQLTEKEL